MHTSGAQEHQAFLPSALSNIWVPKISSLQTMLDVMNTVKGDIAGATHIVVRDCDGTICNKVGLEFKAEMIASLDLSLLIGECKEDCGMQHATVEVRSPASFVHGFRLVGTDGSQPMRESFKLSRTAPFFSFISKNNSVKSHYALMNLGEDEAEIQCRLYLDRSYREVVKILPPYGTRILKIENDFEEALALETEQLPRYIRVSQKSERSQIAVQFIERIVDENGTRRFVSFS
jgi:hypothetical protein